MDAADIAESGAEERVMISADSRQAHIISRLLVACAVGWLVLILRDHRSADWHSPGNATWSLSLIIAVVVVARGLFQGRSVTSSHVITAVFVLLTGVGAHLFSFELLRDALTVSAGVILVWPVPSRTDPHQLPRVSELVAATHGDPLAPFAMQSMKSYYFNAEGTAAIAYRARWGYAVVSGDPIGQRDRFPQLAVGFVALCKRRGWHVIVLACSAPQLGLWRDADLIGKSLRPIPIGRDVVLDLDKFSLTGRTYRNLRQAVQRTHNAGVTTAVVSEQELDPAVKHELTELLHAGHRAAHVERGFSMILDHVLEGRYPGIKLIIARDRAGRVQGFHRYAVAGGGSDVTLDLPWRRPDAPNGIDERLTVDMIDDCRKSGGQRLSLAFAAFPELFDNKHRGWIDSGYYFLIHLGDSLIRLESLYRYLRKFHAFGQRRYVLLSMRHIPAAFVILLSLEFMPRPRR